MTVTEARDHFDTLIVEGHGDAVIVSSCAAMLIMGEVKTFISVDGYQHDTIDGVYYAHSSSYANRPADIVVIR
jgi:hypothetical protein